MKVMALDVGTKRIGVAVSDPSGMLARSLKVIQRRPEGPAADIAAIARLIADESAQRVVVGLPLTLRGEIGPQAQFTLSFIDALRDALEIRVETWDESYSTVAAEGALRSQGLRGRRQKERVDATAAAIILQGYLEANPQPNTPKDNG